MTLKDWFSEHPRALATLRVLRSNGGSYRECVEALKRGSNFPFSDHTSLMDYCKRNGVEGTPAPAETVGPEKTPETFHRSDADVRRIESHGDYVVTCAVSSCPAVPKFLAALEKLKAHRGHRIVVSPVRYRNPTRREDVDTDEWWDESLRDYLLDSEISPHKRLAIMPTKIQATTNNPLPPRLTGMTRDRDAVFGHPQLMMRTVAAPHANLAKRLFSSGAVTQPSYSDTLTGDLGHFYHTAAAVIVEVRGDQIHLRDINFDGDGFFDAGYYYTAGGYTDAPSAVALVMGDLHERLVAPNVLAATFGPGGIVEVLDPKYLVLHDAFDGASVNPHEAANRLLSAARHRELNVEREVNSLATRINALPEGLKIRVPHSNHDDFLDRWLAKGEKGVLPENALLYHRLMAAMLSEYEMSGNMPQALEIALEGKVTHPDVEFLREEDSFRPCGVELAMHGHLGPNGARGSIRNLSQIGTRSIIGHSHSPGIHQGVYQVGQSAVPRHGYNRGPSSWFQAHAILYPNKKRQMLFIIDEAWRG